MLELRTINIDEFDNVFAIMEQSFPDDERRNYTEQRALFDNPEYSIYVVDDDRDNRIKAFIAVWDFEEFAYVEHFAVNPEYRNGGIGAEVLHRLHELMDKQQTFEQALRTREFEPDAPNYTPRISGIMHIDKGEFNYAMSILKSNNGNPDACNRYTFAYSNPVAGEGHFIHTYMGDGNPLPSFEGEPTWVDIDGDIDTFTKMVWENLNEDNKVSLFVRFIDIETGNYESRIVNKNK